MTSSVVSLRRLARADAGQYQVLRIEACADPAFAMPVAALADLSVAAIYSAYLADPSRQVLGAFVDDQLMGIAHIDPAPADQAFVLWGFYISHEYRRRGLGQVLLDATVGLCRQRGAERLTLQVQDQNLAAQALYMGNGFRRLPATPGDRQQPAQEHTLALALRH